MGDETQGGMGPQGGAAQNGPELPLPGGGQGWSGSMDSRPAGIFPDAGGGFVYGTGPRPKKKRRLIWFLIPIGILAAALAAVLVLLLLRPKPEELVRSAMEATRLAQAEQYALETKEVPLLGYLRGENELTGPREASYSITLDSLQSSDATLDEKILFSMLEGLSLQGRTTVDPDHFAAEAEGSLSIQRTTLGSFYGYASPEEIAFGMPDYSDLVYSVNPDTMERDARKNPVFSDNDRLLQQLRQAQELVSMLTGEKKGKGKAPSLSAERLQGIFDGLMEAAEYRRLPKEDNLEIVEATINGGKTRETAILLWKYILQCYPSLGSNPDMQKLMKVMEEDLPELPLTARYEIYPDGLLRRCQLSYAPERPSSILREAEIRWIYSPEGEENFMAEVVLTDGSRDYTTSFNRITAYDGNKHTGRFTAFTEPFGGSAQGAVSVHLNTELQKTGGMNLTGKLKTGSVYGMPEEAYLSAEGSFWEDGDAVSWELKKLGMRMTVAGETASVGCHAKWSQKPSEGLAAPSKRTTPLFSMTEAELALEEQKYRVAVRNRIIGLALLFGVDPSDLNW